MKKYISILLVLTMLASFVSISASAYSWDDPDAITVDEAVAEYEAETGEEVETFRYYFLMPNGSNGERGNDEFSMYYDKYHASWYTRFEDGTPTTNTACIYWWDSDVADPDGWIGYLPSGVDENDPDVYYADVPVAATTIIWNNGVDGGMDPDDPIYYSSAQTVNIPCEYYDAGESPNYPNGTENFDEMIFVITPGLVHTSDLSLKLTCDGEWYYYYGNGCYGFTENGDEDDCLRDDHFDASGNHIGKHTPSVDLTNCVIAGADETDPSKINGTVHGYMGDADGDGEVSVMDATEIQLYVARLKAMDEVSVLLSEVDRDGDTSVMDATEIQLFVARLKTSDVIGRILYTPINELDPEKYTYIKADGEYYMVPPDSKIFTYTSYLACDRKLASVDVDIDYDHNGLKFVPDVDKYGDYTGNEFPNLKAPVYNFSVPSRISYNMSFVSGVRFPVQDSVRTEDNILFSGQFEVIGGPGVYELDTRIIVLGDTNNNRIVYNYEQIDETAVVMIDSEINCDKSPVPTEPPTVPVLKCDICSSSNAYYSDQGYQLCGTCLYYNKQLICDSCGDYGATYKYGDKKYCYNCKYTDCDKCGTAVSSLYYYNGYDLCYNCYYSMRYTNCDRCGTSVSTPYYYDGYELCLSCYNNLSSRIYCDNCGTYVYSPSYYKGYKLCYSCYLSMSNSVTCYYCKDHVSAYKQIVVSGIYRYVCYPCYYTKVY